MRTLAVCQDCGSRETSCLRLATAARYFRQVWNAVWMVGRSLAIAFISSRTSGLSGDLSCRTVLGSTPPLGTLLRNTLPGSEQACTHDVARYHDPALPCVPQPVAHSVSSVLSQQILQHTIVEHGIGQQSFRFKFSSSSDFRRWVSDTFMPPYLALNL